MLRSLESSHSSESDRCLPKFVCFYLAWDNFNALWRLNRNSALEGAEFSSGKKEPE